MFPREWDIKSVLFGSLTTDRVFNLMLLKAKHFIFVKRLEDSNPAFDSFMQVMKSYYQLEKYNAVKNGNLIRFDKDWNAYKICFNA